MTPREFLERKETYERLRRESDRKAGSLELLKKQLKEQFDCSSISAVKLLAEKKKKYEKDEKEANAFWDSVKNELMEKLR